MNPLSKTRLQGWGSGCLLGALTSAQVFAAGEVSSVQVSEQAATPFSYSADGVNYNWGRGNNQLLEGFTVDGRNYGYVSRANDVSIRRDDIADITSGEPCGIFVERLSDTDLERNYAADYPGDASAGGNCQLEVLLESRIINRGLLDTFSNKLPDAKNIERLDYVFYYSAIAPLTEENMSLAGHIVSEKRGNNRVKIAAILSLDAFGQPAEYGPMVLISGSGCTGSDICYGETDLMHTYSFLQNEFNAPQGFPVETERTIEAFSMAFVSIADLGLSAGQRYFGFSIFADDVDASLHDLIDPQTFPDDTSDDFIAIGDDADIYGGLSGYYLGDDLSVISGNLFFDLDEDGVPDADEAGIPDVAVALYSDVNGDGLIQPDIDMQLGDSVLSDLNGSFVFPGPPDGNYIVLLDESDPQIPAGLIVVPGTNPQSVTVAGVDPDAVNFAFVQSSGDGPGDEQGDDPGDGPGDEQGDDPGDGPGDDPGDGSGDGSGDDPGDGSGDDPGDGQGDGQGDDPGDDPGDVFQDPEGEGEGEGEGSGDGDGDGSDPDDGVGEGTDDDVFDDDATMAVSDAFPPQLPVVNQGQAAELDVLANDIDGTGSDSLEIVNVTESENATISITTDSDGNQVLLYQSDPEYYSPEGEPDTFTYTIEDADGTQRTGNVSVTVNRFSDLNGNLVNDFDECDCTDLFLVTGVDGTGIGHISRWLLLSLILVWLLRQTFANRKCTVITTSRMSE